MPVAIEPHYTARISTSKCEDVSGHALTCKQAMFWEKTEGLYGTGVL
jgi:hypothetical protein